MFTTQSNVNKNLSQIKGSFDLQLGFISCLQRHTTIYTIIRVYLGLWPGPKWAGFGQTGLLKTGFTSNGFHSVWVTSKTGLNRVLPG